MNRKKGESGVNEAKIPEGIRLLEELPKEELIKIIIDDAKNWLAHDGLWFQAVEKAYGQEAAIAVDEEAWRHFTVIEARRIMALLGMEPGGGIPALITCLNRRLYARLNTQEIVEVTDKRAVLRMTSCRVQTARQRSELGIFACKSVGIIEYTEFAKVVDPRIKVNCLTCPPDEVPEGYWCAWEFLIQ
jgi:hypothetical protein